MNELVATTGQIVVSISIGDKYTEQELPFVDHETGETKMLKIGNFLSDLLNMAILRDGQAINILFPKLLKYSFTPRDRIYVRNQTVILDFFHRIKDEKLADIRAGKEVGCDLFSIMLDEGGDVYGMIEDKVEADKTMFDDLMLIYLAAV